MLPDKGHPLASAYADAPLHSCTDTCIALTSNCIHMLHCVESHDIATAHTCKCAHQRHGRHPRQLWHADPLAAWPTTGASPGIPRVSTTATPSLDGYHWKPMGAPRTPRSNGCLADLNFSCHGWPTHNLYVRTRTKHICSSIMQCPTETRLYTPHGPHQPT